VHNIFEWLDPGRWSLTVTIGVFLGAAVVIGVAGWKLAGVADRLADRTGMGEVMMGAIFLGATTSLSGSVVSISAALDGRAQLALGNAVGGIAAQTVFLAVADLFYRRANLEHAAAAPEHIMHAALLIVMLGFVLIGAASPDVTLWSIHPVTPIMLAGYLYGLHLIRQSTASPMWQPKRTSQTREEQPEDDRDPHSTASMWGSFALLAALTGLAGYATERAASRLTDLTALSEQMTGVALTSVATSLPELVTSVAAVRRGALALAVSGILGGNAYDTLFVAFADIAYREGAIYHAMSHKLLLFTALPIVMTAILLMGLMRREEHGAGNIGFEGMALLTLYVSALGLLIFVDF
jgi:cation:H+ antiporter